MIYIWSKYQFQLDFTNQKINSLQEINTSIQVLIVDYCNLKQVLEQKIHLECRCIVLDEYYVQEHQKCCYLNYCYLYIFDQEIANEFINYTLIRLNEKFKMFVTIDFLDNNWIKIANLKIRLTKKEQLILQYLHENRRVCTSEEILTQVLKYHSNSQTRVVSVYIRYLRRKLEESSFDIKTIRKQGYQLITKH